MHPDGLLAAMVKAIPGCCIFCEEPLPKKRCAPRVVCGSPGCQSAYQCAYGRDRRLGISVIEARLGNYFAWCTGAAA
jgi:hypothetical protein